MKFTNDYKLLNWKDRIWKIGPDSKLIPKKDGSGQPILNPISGQPEFETIEDGTRVSASRLNHMDEGIYAAHEFNIELAALVRRMQVQMELDGRVPGNSGTFADTLDGSTNKITLDKTQKDIVEAVVAGTTVLKVANTTGFSAFTQVTVYDADHSEDVLITAINADAKTITVQALQHDYKKGAKVARSNVTIDTTLAEMSVGHWQTYNVQLMEVI